MLTIHKVRYQIILGFFLISCIPPLISKGQSTEIVKYSLIYPREVKCGEVMEIKSLIQVEAGWHIYAPDPLNSSQGMQVTQLRFGKLPSGIRKKNGLQISKPLLKDGFLVYIDDGGWLLQQFIVDKSIAPGEIKLTGQFVYQPCTDQICYPPYSANFEVKVMIVK